MDIEVIQKSWLTMNHCKKNAVILQRASGMNSLVAASCLEVFRNIPKPTQTLSNYLSIIIIIIRIYNIIVVIVIGGLLRNSGLDVSHTLRK